MKIKYHLLPHIKEDIIRFGPMVGVASEVFEGFNTIFRYCSILSNHLAPSRDIAHQLSKQETVKHILSGGRWFDKTKGWTSPGPSVQGFVTKNPMLQALIGWPRDEKFIPGESSKFYAFNSISHQIIGTVRLEPVPRDEKRTRQPRSCFSWMETHAISAVNGLENSHQEDSKLSWYRGKYVIARSDDQCKNGAWVYATSPFTVGFIFFNCRNLLTISRLTLHKTTEHSQPPITGQIIEILQDTTARRSLVVLDTFQVAANRHDIFGMPVLLRPLNEKRLIIVPATASGTLFPVFCETYPCILRVSYLNLMHNTTARKPDVVQQEGGLSSKNELSPISPSNLLNTSHLMNI